MFEAKSDPRAGVALVTSLVVMLAAFAIIGAVLTYATQSARVTRRAIDHQRAQIAAEAGLDYGIDQILRLMRQYQFTLDEDELQELVDKLSTPPSVYGYKYETPMRQSAFDIEIESDVNVGEIVDGNFKGSVGRYQYITVRCGAVNPKSGVGAVVKQQLQALSLFYIRFGVFYEEDLEILPGPRMIFSGPVHSNGDLYLGGPLEFNDRLTTPSDVFHRRKNSGEAQGEVMIMDNYGTLRSMLSGGTAMDSAHDQFTTESLGRWGGQVKTGAHNVSRLDPPINPNDEPHDLIERALDMSDPDYDPMTESEKFENKAMLKIHVDASGTLSATDYNGQDVTHLLTQAELDPSGTYDGNEMYSKSGDGSYDMRTDGSYDTTKTFKDQRENTTMAPVDIYVDQLLEQIPDLYSGTAYSAASGRGIVYVTRDDPDGAGGAQPVVRIRNGQELPDGGLSFASDLPVYIEGDFNVDGDVKPALVTGDAVTLLSTEWQDARSRAGIDVRRASSTDYNAVIMTGNTDSEFPTADVKGAYNGGLENVLRFQENWSDQTVQFRGSIIDIWKSEIADSAWHYGSYYTAPNRDWGYDELYRTDAPPGIPRLFGLEELAWTRSTFEAEGWTYGSRNVASPNGLISPNQIY